MSKPTTTAFGSKIRQTLYDTDNANAVQTILAPLNDAQLLQVFQDSDRRCTLLHKEYIYRKPHLLPALIGTFKILNLDINSRDGKGYTPLHVFIDILPYYGKPMQD